MKPFVKNRLWIVGIAIILIFIYKADFSQSFSKLYAVLLPVIIALLFAWFLIPLKKFLEGLLKTRCSGFLKKYSHTTSALIVYVVFLAAICFFIICLIPIIKDSISNIGIQFDNYRHIIEKYVSPETINRILNKINPEIYINSAKNTIFFIGDIAMAIVILIYILLEHKNLKKTFADFFSFLAGSERAEKALYYISRTNKIFSEYFYSKFISSVMLGVMVIAGFFAGGISYPLFFGIIVALSNMIPVFGILISAIPIAVLTFAEYGFAKTLVSVLIITVAQQIENNILTPKIVGNTVGLSGFWILVTTILGGGLFGFWGLLICVPVAATLKMFFEELKIRNKR